MENQRHHVFVYGTLKRGEPNHKWFCKDSNGYHKFVCDGVTSVKFPLVIATKHNIPLLLYSPGNGKYVKGEVYEIDDIVLANLDILEEYPDLYAREIHDIKDIGGSKTIQAWIYLIKQFNSELLNCDTYENYSSFGEHGLIYDTSIDSPDSDIDLKKAILGEKTAI